MGPLYFLFGGAALVWLLSLTAAVLAVRWGLARGSSRFWAAMISSALALFLAYEGMTHFRLAYSRTVNGSGFSLNSKWFLMTTLILGVAALALTIWNRWRSRDGAQKLH
jgi:hypothetical protein